MKLFSKSTVALVLIIGFGLARLNAQAVDSLSTQVINVNTRFNPTVENAQKMIPVIPKFNSSSKDRANQLKYNILEVPVASTFTPAKGKIVRSDALNENPLFNSMMYLGYGSNGLPNASMVTDTYIKDSQFIFEGNYFGTNQPISEIPTEINQQIGDFGVRHNLETSTWEFDSSLSYDFQGTTWYGLYDDSVLTPELINSLGEMYSFQSIGIRSKISREDFAFTKGEFKAYYNFDNYDSQEIITEFNNAFSLEIGEPSLLIPFNMAYQKTSFNAVETPYQYFNIDIGARFEKNFGEKSRFDIGILLSNFNNIETEETSFYFQPSLSFKTDLNPRQGISAYLSSSVNRHSMMELLKENPFLAPELSLQPTYQPYDLGVKFNTLISEMFELKLNAGYTQFDDQVVFSKGVQTALPQENYQYGNSFTSLFDQVNELYFKLSLEGNIGNHFTTNLKMRYSHYEMETLQSYFNQAPFEFYLNGTYEQSNWTLGIDLFIIGNSEDLYQPNNSFETVLIENDGFLDLNLSASYKINKNWKVDLLLSNLLNQNYQEFANFQVQGFQAMGGIQYLFNL